MRQKIIPKQAQSKSDSLRRRSRSANQTTGFADHRLEVASWQALQQTLDTSSRTSSLQEQVKQSFGQEPRKPSHDQGEVIQRLVDRNTLKQWKQSAGKSRDRQRKVVFAEITDLIESLAGNPYDELNREKLKAKIQQLLPQEHYAKYKDVLQTVLIDASDEDPLSRSEIEAYVNHHLDRILPTGEGDLALPEVRELRQRILIHRLSEDKYSKNRMESSIQGLAQRGVLKGQWVGRGLCQEATLAKAGGSREIKPHNNGSSINWNHYIIDQGNTWLDPTWKQFFQLEHTQGINPLFEGDVEKFRQLGMPQAATDDYLLYIGKYNPKPLSQ